MSLLEVNVRLQPLVKGRLAANPATEPFVVSVASELPPKEAAEEILKDPRVEPHIRHLAVDGHHLVGAIRAHLVSHGVYERPRHSLQTIDYLDGRRIELTSDAESWRQVRQEERDHWRQVHENDAEAAARGFPRDLALEVTYPTETWFRQAPRGGGTRPVIFLDVDGVINYSYGVKKDVDKLSASFDAAARREFREARVFSSLRGREITTTYSPYVVDRINAWADRAVYWSTSWGADAKYRLAPALGLDDFVSEPELPWKCWESFGEDLMASPDLAHILDRPVVWIDDEQDYIERAVTSLKKRHFNPGDILLVDTNHFDDLGYVGLSPANLDDVDAFIAAFQAGDGVADIAEPFGVIDLTDIDAFIAAFLGGCP